MLAIGDESSYSVFSMLGLIKYTDVKGDESFFKGLVDRVKHWRNDEYDRATLEKLPDLCKKLQEISNEINDDCLYLKKDYQSAKNPKQKAEKKKCLEEAEAKLNNLQKFIQLFVTVSKIAEELKKPDPSLDKFKHSVNKLLQFLEEIFEQRRAVELTLTVRDSSKVDAGEKKEKKEKTKNTDKLRMGLGFLRPKKTQPPSEIRNAMSPRVSQHSSESWSSSEKSMPTYIENESLSDLTSSSSPRALPDRMQSLSSSGESGSIEGEKTAINHDDQLQTKREKIPVANDFPEKIEVKDLVPDKLLAVVQQLTNTPATPFRQLSTQPVQEQTNLISSAAVAPANKTPFKQYTVEQIDQWLFKGNNEFSNELPVSKLVTEGRNKDRYAPKKSFHEVPMLGEGKISSRIGIHSGGITDLKTTEKQSAAVGDSNNGDLLTGCGYAVAKAIVNATGAGLQAELYNNYGVPAVMKTTEYGKKNYGSSEGRGYALTCGSYEMKDSHGIDAVELLTVPMRSEDGVVKMYLEALIHSKDKDFIALPMAGMSHPVIDNKSAKSAELTLKAVKAFYEQFPDSQLKIIFTIFNDVYSVNQYKNAIMSMDALL